MSTRMQQRRGTASQWTISDPILAEGEFGWESDTNKFKIGDGVNNWSLLEYFEDSAAAGASLDDYVPLALLGAADGVATLDSNGYVPVSQLGNIIDAAPGALDTLNELAAALNDDENFYTTITNYVDTSVAAAQPTFTNNFMLMGA